MTADRGTGLVGFLVGCVNAGFLAWWAEDVENERVLQGLGAVRRVAGEVQDGTAFEYALTVFFGRRISKSETNAARENDCKLLIFMAMGLDLEALVEQHMGDHRLLADDATTIDLIHGMVRREFIPDMDMKRVFLMGHNDRVYRVCCCDVGNAEPAGASVYQSELWQPLTGF
jgi:hypothetical protein